MLTITAKIDKTVKKYNMLSRGDFVVVGVSGGADSMLLLSYLVYKQKELGLRLIAANVEHGIRGKASLEDTDFVRKYCEKNGIEFKCLSINAIKEAKEAGLGVEEYSRLKRYEFFSSFGADKIATAHSLSDSAETVLFRLLRGASLKGICGISAVRDNIVRPLIECSSEEIRQACRDNGIPYVVDETNSDNAYSRNFIRNEIIPDFKKLNPSFENAVMRFSSSAREAEDYLNIEAEKCYIACYKNNCLDLSELRKYHIAVAKRAIIMFAESRGITLDGLHLNSVFELVNKQGRRQLKGSMFAVADKSTLRLAEFKADVNFDNYLIKQKIVSADEFLNNCELLKKEFAFYCDYDKIAGSVNIRERKEGDSISPLGRGLTKSLKKLFNELKIPVEKRQIIPVICDDKGVVGIYGYCIDERVKIDKETKNILLIILTEDNK